MTIIAAALSAASGPALAQQLVTNGGFESGTFSGWTGTSTTAGPNYDGVDTGDPFTSAPTPHSGRYEAYLGSIGTSTTLSQTLLTVPGQSYTFSFYLLNDTAASTGYMNFFSASFGGGLLYVNSNASTFPYQKYSVDVVASSASSLLTFTSRNDGGYFELDDVSVLADASVSGAPEPATWLMMVLGFGAAGAAWRRPQRNGPSRGVSPGV